MDTPFYHQNKKFNQQNHIQSNRESQDSTSILTSFPICDLDINKEPWFHGVLPRAEVERLLQNQGDFLVRQTSKRSSGRDTLAHWNGTNGDSINGNHNETILNKDHNIDGTVLRMVLSVFWHGHRHFIVYGGPDSGEGWHLEDGHFSTIRAFHEDWRKFGQCLSCGKFHAFNSCKSRNSKWFKCDDIGYIQSVCNITVHLAATNIKSCNSDSTESSIYNDDLSLSTIAIDSVESQSSSEVNQVQDSCETTVSHQSIYQNFHAIVPVNEVTNFFERGSDVEDDINTLASTNTHITENNQSVLVSSTSDTFLVPPLPPHNLGHNKSLSSSSISTPNVDNINTKRYTDSVMLRSDHKESSQVITSAIDAQVKSINEMLSYFSKLVKAEKTVQQALSDLLDDQMESSTVGGVGGGGQRSNTTTMRNLFKANYSRGRRRRLTMNILNKNLSNSSTDSELNKLLQNLVISTNHQARMYSTRALFHKLITAGQLDSLNNCEQCLRRTYLECEEELKSQARQNQKFSSDQKSQFNEGLINNRKVIDSLMNNLEYSTKKLHLLHNEYCLALITANHYQQWLYTHLRPCLLKGVERTMQLASEVV
ncbi:unnamed protein product [Schistosoma margrebowiei]|uniref:Uncharacterized protein n=1 Tax=Schistosoma margrebowiei TaxID=48269 RepID=A0A183MRQ7_9TREM|nr:unnamed protein product [Schistosoma margrebowiei]